MNSPKKGRLEVRRARPADAPEVARLCVQLGYRTPLSQVRRDEPSLISDPSRAELVGLVVDEGFRSGGVGAKLVAAAEAWAKGQKLATMRLRCNVVREAAHRFYERRGYAHVKTSKVFDKRLA